MILVRVGWRLLVPWATVLFLLGLLLAGYWGHRGMMQERAARLAEVRAGKDVAEAALTRFAPTKFHAAEAKLAVVREANRER